MIATADFFGYELPKRTIYQLVRQVGIDGIMLWWSDEFGDDSFRDNPDIARSNGLFIENVHTPFENINDIWFDNLNGHSLTNTFMQYVDECAERDILTMVMHLSKTYEPPPYNEIGLNRIKKIIEKAENKNVYVAFENLRRLEYLDYIMTNIDSPHAVFCYDSGHQNCWNPDIDILNKYGPRLRSLHLNDNDSTDDQHLLPFEGTLNWEYTMKKIAQTGYSGTISMETENVGYEKLTPYEFLSILFERAKILKDLMK